VRELQRRFMIDGQHAERVHSIADALYASIAPRNGADARRELGWACALHEIGMMVSHHDHHRHSAYLLAHADAAGFSQSQQRRLAELALAQRGGLRKVEPALSDPLLRDQALALRLALLLCHARRDPTPGRLQLQRSEAGYRFFLDAAWARAHPQSMHLLREEQKAWARLAWAFEVVVQD
jgi:exopolyphosphatase/guanosine-5'-triphosphate,3'-diphosphate pyrophosphatase